MNKVKLYTTFTLLLLLPMSIYAECTCETEAEDRNKAEALKLKLIAIASILIAGAIGVSLPILGKFTPAFQPETDISFLIKAFVAGVILATGFVHVLPDAFESLPSPCLGETPGSSFRLRGCGDVIGGGEVVTWSCS